MYVKCQSRLKEASIYKDSLKSIFSNLRKDKFMLALSLSPSSLGWSIEVY